MISRKLEQYIAEHITEEDPILEDLFRQTHIRFVNPNMASGHSQGIFLELISKMIQPQNILEIGTFTGYSAICLARGLAQGGKLITIELNDELTEFAGSYFKRAGLGENITQLTGDALEIIPGLDQMFDLVFLDGDKREYTEYFDQVFSKVRPGGIIIADNVLWGGKVIEHDVSDPQALGIIEFNEMIKKNMTIKKMIVPLRDGLTIIQKPS
jgi:caffeoyl-CoA O-methyltransferase